MDTVSGLARDTVLTHIANNSKRSFEIVEVISSTKQLLVIDKNNHDLQIGDELTEEASNLAYTVIAIANPPDINKFSGDLLYIDNRTSVSHSAQQLVTLRTVIKL
jgi:hypothetical protein